MDQTFGQILKQLRTERQLNLRDAARKANVDPRTYETYEKNDDFKGQTGKLDQILLMIHGVSSLSLGELRAINKFAVSDIIAELRSRAEAANAGTEQDGPQSAGKMPNRAPHGHVFAGEHDEPTDQSHLDSIREAIEFAKAKNAELEVAAARSAAETFILTVGAKRAMKLFTMLTLEAQNREIDSETPDEVTKISVSDLTLEELSRAMRPDSANDSEKRTARFRKGSKAQLRETSFEARPATKRMGRGLSNLVSQPVESAAQPNDEEIDA